MPAITESKAAPEPTNAASAASAPTPVQFPPVTRKHILHCSYDYWFPKYT